MRKLVVLILASLAAGPAFADPPASNAGSVPDPNETICRNKSVIGSRVNRIRQCATRAQWVELQATERRQTRDIQRQGNQPQCMSPGERAAGAGRYSALGVSCN